MKKNKYTFLEWVFDNVGFGKFILFFYLFCLVVFVGVLVGVYATASSKQKQWEVVTKSCTLEKSFVTTEGVKVCDYVCGGADKQHIYKTYFSNTASCPKTIEEKIKVAK